LQGGARLRNEQQEAQGNPWLAAGRDRGGAGEKALCHDQVSGLLWHQGGHAQGATELSYRALLSVYRALLSVYRALLSVYRTLLSSYLSVTCLLYQGGHAQGATEMSYRGFLELCRALLSVYRALLSVNRAFLSVCMALLSVYRTLLSRFLSGNAHGAMEMSFCLFL